MFFVGECSVEYVVGQLCHLDIEIFVEAVSISLVALYKCLIFHFPPPHPPNSYYHHHLLLYNLVGGFDQFEK